jgi:hypothetical protein
VERNSGAWAGRQSFRHDPRNSGTVVWQGDLTGPGGMVHGRGEGAWTGQVPARVRFKMRVQ